MFLSRYNIINILLIYNKKRKTRRCLPSVYVRGYIYIFSITTMLLTADEVNINLSRTSHYIYSNDGGNGINEIKKKKHDNNTFLSSNRYLWARFTRVEYFYISFNNHGNQILYSFYFAQFVYDNIWFLCYFYVFLGIVQFHKQNMKLSV